MASQTSPRGPSAWTPSKPAAPRPAGVEEKIDEIKSKSPQQQQPKKDVPPPSSAPRAAPSNPVPLTGSRVPALSPTLTTNSKARISILELAARWLHVPAIAATRREDKYRYLQYRGLTSEEIDELFIGFFEAYDPVSVIRMLFGITKTPIFLSFKFAQPISSVQIEHSPSPFFVPFQKQIDDIIETKKGFMSPKDIQHIVDSVQELIYKNSKTFFLYDPDINSAVSRQPPKPSEQSVSTSSKTNLRPLIIEVSKFFELLRVLTGAAKNFDLFHRCFSIQRYFQFLKLREKYPQEHIAPPLDVKVIWYLHLLKGFTAFTAMKSFKSIFPDPNYDFFDMSLRVVLDDKSVFKCTTQSAAKNLQRSELLWRDEFGTNYSFEFVYRREGVTLDIEKDLQTIALQRIGVTLDFIEDFFLVFESVAAVKDAKSGTLVDHITAEEVATYNEIHETYASTAINFSKHPSVVQLLAFAHSLNAASFSSNQDVDIRYEGPIKSIHDALEIGSVVGRLFRLLDDRSILSLQASCVRAYLRFSSPDIWKAKLLKHIGVPGRDTLEAFESRHDQRTIWKMLYFQAAGLVD